MKHKIIGILSMVLMLFLVGYVTYEVGTDMPNSRARYHQHISGRQPDEGCSCDKSELCTHLPLIMIDTGGEEIPGKILYDERGKIKEFSRAEDGSKMIPVRMKLMDNEHKNHHPSDIPDVESGALIRVRGNSSREYPKQNYLLRLIDEEGKYREKSLAGMSAHYEWALHGPYLDKTLIRNYMCYNVAGEFMDFSPSVRFCELILNGEYRGLYLITETISRGNNCRISLSAQGKDADATSYIVRMDRGSEKPYKNLDSFGVYTYRTTNPMDIKYPRSGELTQEKIHYIEQDICDFEKSLYSFDYDTPEHGYFNDVDVDSFADYFLLNEFTLNYDATTLSTHIYKDLRGKLTVVPWDFNSAFDNYEEPQAKPQGFRMQENLWLYMMVKDEAFTERVINNYRELRKSYLSDRYLMNYIDETVAFLGDAVDRNYTRWGGAFDENMLNPKERNPKSYEEAVEDLKTAIRTRGVWMDQHIDVLRQYSHESKNKKFNH